MTSAKHNILVLVAASSVNTGPVKGILQFIKHIRSPDISFHLFNFWQRNNPIPDPFELQTKAIGIPCNFIRIGRNNYFLMIFDAVRAVKRTNISIIQTHGFKPSFIGFCVKYICGIRWICFMHGTTSENWKVKLYNHIDSVLQLFADHVVLVTGNQRPKIIGGENKQRVSVIHNAVDIHHPVRISDSVDSIRNNLQIPADATLIAVVGRLSPEKGIDVFIEAFDRIATEDTTVYAVIVGDGQEKLSLIGLASEKKCSERIFFVGHTSTPGDYMIAADIVVLPSRSEGIPNVALEAMALGKPVVATAVGGTPEVIEDSISGLLVPSENPDLMAKAVMRVIHETCFAKQLAQGALNKVKKCFSIDSRCDKLVNLYSKL